MSRVTLPVVRRLTYCFFFFNDTATTEIYTLSLHDALPIFDALRRLPADRRRALVLRFVDEMSTAEIAGVLGRSEGAVRVLIHRALRSVAADLTRRGR